MGGELGAAANSSTRKVTMREAATQQIFVYWEQPAEIGFCRQAPSRRMGCENLPIDGGAKPLAGRWGLGVAVGEGGELRRDLATEERDGHNRDNRDKGDENAVLGEGCALVVRDESRHRVLDLAHRTSFL